MNVISKWILLVHRALFDVFGYFLPMYRVKNSIILIVFDYRFWSLFCLLCIGSGTSYIFLIRARGIEERTEKEISARTGFLQRFVFFVVLSVVLFVFLLLRSNYRSNYRIGQSQVGFSETGRVSLSVVEKMNDIDTKIDKKEQREKQKEDSDGEEERNEYRELVLNLNNGTFSGDGDSENGDSGNGDGDNIQISGPVEETTSSKKLELSRSGNHQKIMYIIYAFLGGTGYHYRHEIVAISLPVFKNIYSILWTTSYVTGRGIWTASRFTGGSIVRLGYGIYSFISGRRGGPPPGPPGAPLPPGPPDAALSPGPPDAPVPTGPPDAPVVLKDLERDERREDFFDPLHFRKFHKKSK